MKPYIFDNVKYLVPFARARAQRGLYNGQMNTASRHLMALCSHILNLSHSVGATIIYTRDVGHHENGWWKNPDYDKCLHLSLSFRDWKTGHPIEYDKKAAQGIAIAFFGDDADKCWIEPAVSPEGKEYQVYHHRLFCDEHWQPILPRGEVYNKENTPKGWKSFSEIYGWSPKKEQAPFLLGA